MARDAGLPLVTHTWSDAVALVANGRLRVRRVLRARRSRWTALGRLMERLLKEPLGAQRLPGVLTEMPGLGVTLSDEVLEELAVAQGETMVPGNYADLVFGQARMTASTTRTTYT